MTSFLLIVRNLRHFMAENLATAAGIAIATAVISGALIIGDSLRLSLERLVEQRLGAVTYTITAGERIFTRQLATNLSDHDDMAAAVLKTEAVVSVQGSNLRLNKVQLWGIDHAFLSVTGSTSGMPAIRDSEVAVNAALAGRLNIDTGDFLLVRMQRIGNIPANTPLVAEQNQSISRRLKVTAILTDSEYGNFNIQASQTTAMNAFVSIDWLNRVMELDNRANMILIRAAGDKDADALARELQTVWTPVDGNIVLEQVAWAGTNLPMASSERVFFDPYLSESISLTSQQPIKIFSYFFNTAAFGDKRTPYSFVTAISYAGAANHAAGRDGDDLHPAMRLGTGEAMVNQWMADDLGVSVGDSITVWYYNIGPLRELTENHIRLKVVDMVPMAQSQKDTVLIPHLPGLSDAGNCRDWDAGIPIDLDAIRPTDEDYWDIYRSAPKLYVSFDQATTLWSNRFGNTTGILLQVEGLSDDVFADALRQNANPFQFGFRVHAVRDEGLRAARGGVDFGQLFLGLGIFIIVGGLMLSMLLLGFSIKKRTNHIRLFVYLGFGKKLIQKIFLWEALAISSIGILLGLGLAIVYSSFIFSALNKNWYDIVRTDSLQLFFLPQTLAFSLVISWLTGMLIVWISVRRAIGQHLAFIPTPNNGNDTASGLPDNKPGKAEKALNRLRGIPNPATGKLFRILSASLLTIAIGTAALLIIHDTFDVLYAWLGCGLALLVSGLLAAYASLRHFRLATSGAWNIRVLAWRNMVRNPMRSFTIIALLALGSFVITVTAANRRASVTDNTIKKSGTGGFQYMAEVTVPILRNLNQQDTRRELGLTDHTSFVQFASAFDDDASCLNLNMVANPRILATEPEALQGRFSFVARHSSLDQEDPWSTLNKPMDGLIPAIADQSVIQWGLGKKIGDTLNYINARGEQIRLLLTGGLANSVFQGHVIISSDHFTRNFPGNPGSQLLLIETAAHDSTSALEDLPLIFGEYGWTMSNTLDVLAAFHSVENTYLHIFFLMGAFGMLLGTIGLAIVMAKNIIERRAETAMLRALGFRTRQLLYLFYVEFGLLFITGMLLGTASALLATLPNYLTANQTVPAEFLISVLAILTAMGMLWMWLIPLIMLQKIRPKVALLHD